MDKLTSPSFPQGIGHIGTEAEGRAARSARLARTPLPCPFCGADVLPAAEHRWGKSHEWHYFALGCENEDCPVEPRVTGNTVAEAMARWNVRA